MARRLPRNQLLLQRTAQLLVLALAALMVSCGGSSSSSSATSTPVSNIKQRVFVSNFAKGRIEIINGSNDQPTLFTITTGTGPTTLMEVLNKEITIVYNSSEHSIGSVSNTTETQAGTASLTSDATSLAVASDGNTAYASLPDSICAGDPLTGALVVVNLGTSAITNCLEFQDIQKVVLSHNNSRLLAFTTNSVYFIATGNLAAGSVLIADPAGLLDHPVDAVFSDDDSTAYVLSCGRECGGTSASVTTLDLGTRTLGTRVPVAAARVALLSAPTLFVAGTDPVTGGSVQAVNVSNMTAGAPFTITDGVHDRIALASNNQLFIGARACSNTVRGCLSMFDISAHTTTYSLPNPATTGDDVTGIEPIPNRNVVYVCEGGNLRIYDTGTHLLTGSQIDIVGRAVDVRALF